MSLYIKRNDEFINAVSMRGFDLVQSIIARGRNNEELKASYTIFGDIESKKCVVIISGVHGVEGELGSIVQCHLLKETPKLEGVAICLIHAVNPYGMHESRRVNEDNVDVNRNFINFNVSGLFNSGYNDYISSICPSWSQLPTKESVIADILSWIDADGINKIQSIITAGQYHDPDGLFFGGHRPSSSQKFIERTMSALRQRFDRFIILDIHSGLGERGKLSIIHEGGSGFGSEKVFSESINYNSNNAISSYLNGSLCGACCRLVPRSVVEAYVLEVGTHSPISILATLQRDNWIYRNNIKSGKEFYEVKKELISMFFLDDEQWLISATSQLINAISRSLSFMINIPSEIDFMRENV